jgi:hypothetical protein
LFEVVEENKICAATTMRIKHEGSAHLAMSPVYFNAILGFMLPTH